MDTQKPAEGGQEQQPITQKDIVDYLRLRGSIEMRRRISVELEREGSDVRRWYDNMQRLASDPNDNLDWGKIARLLPEEEL